MSKIPGLTDEQLTLVRGSFPSGTEIKLFGSRVTGGYRTVSDLDICVLSHFLRADMDKINNLFKESNLPFAVDIFLYSDCGNDFRKVIDATGVKL
jgi:predicted nucleotidyltransferase